MKIHENSCMKPSEKISSQPEVESLRKIRKIQNPLWKEQVERQFFQQSEVVHQDVH